jgi:hypothetical protein
LIHFFRPIQVSDNLVYDTISNGGGIHVSNRYNNVRGETGIKGEYKINRNTMLRAGNSDYNWHFGVGAIWFSGLNEDIHADIEVKENDIIDASYSAIAFIEGKVYGVVFDDLIVNGTGTYFLQLQAGGDITLKNVKASGIGKTNPIYNCGNSGAKDFKITAGDGVNKAWFDAKPDCPGGGEGGINKMHPTAYPMNEGTPLNNRQLLGGN